MKPDDYVGLVAQTHAQTRPLLIQFAKWPEAGKVKTRLIPALGPLGALEAHLTLTRQVLSHLLATGHPVEFWWDQHLRDGSPEASLIAAELEASGVCARVQFEGNLGYRMLSALNDGLARATRVVIVGSDCPSVDPAYIQAALDALDTSDVVLGPAEDGGFVLIAARRTDPEMLDGVVWGSRVALKQTQAQLKRRGVTTGLLDYRWDVDEIGDWERFLAVQQVTSRSSDRTV